MPGREPRMHIHCGWVPGTLPCYHSFTFTALTDGRLMRGRLTAERLAAPPGWREHHATSSTASGRSSPRPMLSDGPGPHRPGRGRGGAGSAGRGPSRGFAAPTAASSAGSHLGVGARRGGPSPVPGHVPTFAVAAVQTGEGDDARGDDPLGGATARAQAAELAGLRAEVKQLQSQIESTASRRRSELENGERAHAAAMTAHGTSALHARLLWSEGVPPRSPHAASMRPATRPDVHTWRAHGTHMAHAHGARVPGHGDRRGSAACAAHSLEEALSEAGATLAHERREHAASLASRDAEIVQLRTELSQQEACHQREISRAKADRRVLSRNSKDFLEGKKVTPRAPPPCILPRAPRAGGTGCPPTRAIGADAIGTCGCPSMLGCHRRVGAGGGASACGARGAVGACRRGQERAAARAPREGTHAQGPSGGEAGTHTTGMWHAACGA